ADRGGAAIREAIRADVEERVDAPVAGVAGVLVRGGEAVLEVVFVLHGGLGICPRPARDVAGVLAPAAGERGVRFRVDRVRGELDRVRAGGVGGISGQRTRKAV